MNREYLYTHLLLDHVKYSHASQYSLPQIKQLFPKSGLNTERHHFRDSQFLLELITQEKQISEMEYESEIEEQNSKLTFLILP